jgi:hypothetical protein
LGLWTLELGGANYPIALSTDSYELTDSCRVIGRPIIVEWFALRKLRPTPIRLAFHNANRGSTRAAHPLNCILTSLGHADALGRQMQAAAEEGLREGDWHRAYEAAKSWVMGGGGAPLPDPWLVYAASALLHGQPRIAVHSIDLGLGHWVEPPADRAILYAVRGWIILEALRDPKTAIDDFSAAQESSPTWLLPAVAEGLRRSSAGAATSRKRKPTVGASPKVVKPSTAPVRPGSVARSVGSVPSVWRAVSPHLPLPASG